jgi:hypothetical protein
MRILWFRLIIIIIILIIIIWNIAQWDDDRHPESFTRNTDDDPSDPRTQYGRMQVGVASKGFTWSGEGRLPFVF